MSTAFKRINVVTKAHNVLMELVNELESNFYLNIVALALKENYVVNSLAGLVHVLDITDNTVGLMESNLFRFFFSLIFIKNGKTGVQISCLMKTILYVVFFETNLIKYGVVGKKIDPGSGFLGLAEYGKQALLKLDYGITSLIFILIDKTARLNANSQICGQRINNGRTHTVETAAGLIRIIVKLTSGVKCREYETLGAYAFLMHAYGDTTTVIGNGCGAVGFQCHMNLCTVACQMLIDRVIKYFVHKMIETSCRNTAYIHTGTFSDRLETFKDGYTLGIISILTHK